MRPIRSLLAVLVAAAALLLVSAPPGGAGGGGGGGPCRGFTRSTTVLLQDSCFDGVAMLVEPGTTELSVTNRGAGPHTMTAVDGSFDLRLEPGDSGTVTLPDAAVLPVYCTLHGTTDGSGMAGVVVVDGAPVRAAAATGIDADLADAVPPTRDRSSSAAWAVAGSAGIVVIGALGALGLQHRRRPVAP